MQKRIRLVWRDHRLLKYAKHPRHRDFNWNLGSAVIVSWVGQSRQACVGNKVHFHGFGVGVQMYTWNGTAWGPAVPEATLFHADAVVAIHFAGPSWQSNSGSIVVGLPEKAVIVDTNAIPWVRLSAKSAEGPGIFTDTTFIQRVNTTGGKTPSVNGAFVGQVARVPYTADYFFYRQAND